MSETEPVISGSLISNWRAPNPWARISEIAAKVGVGPIKPGVTGTICASGADGNVYDIWEVLAGVLDTISKATNDQTES